MPVTNPEDSAWTVTRVNAATNVPPSAFGTMTTGGDLSSWNGPVCWTCGARHLGAHVCTGARQFVPTFPMTPVPVALYVVQACPVCQGRGNVPYGFYSRLTVATDLNPEPCQSCDGKGLLKVGAYNGSVEKLT